jgi:hypothetical protein
MATSRTVGQGRGAVFASDGKVYLEGAAIPADVQVGDHVFTDVAAVEGNVEVAVVKPITAESQQADDTDPSRGTIADVTDRVDSGEVTAADALAAEQAKGDKARATLVADLEARVAAESS